MILLDMVRDRELAIPRESASEPQLRARLRAAAGSVGTLGAFPDTTTGAIEDDHTPFEQLGAPAIELIDFTDRCWHLRCDDLRHVSERSLATVGTTVLAFLRGL